MDNRTRVFIADDHPIFREGLVKTIERHSAFSLIGQAADGAEALRSIRELHPDIAILDVEMPKMSGIDVARSVHKEALPTELIFLTMYKDAAYFNAALDLGVRGYLLKDVVAGELVSCLNTVAEGEYYISPAISQLLIERKKRSDSLLRDVPSLNRLTPSEKHILRLLAENLTSKEIAEKLFVSIRTVENHRLHMCQKLEIRGHNKLLQFALENKMAL
jgi:DNA-binding NarL/FixJ family response regulator